MSATFDSRCFASAPRSTLRGVGDASVLIVDDERINREVLRGILTRNGYRTQLAADGNEALKLIRAETPNLVLLDVVMEPLSGFDVLREIRKTHRDTELPVVMVTAESDRQTIIDAFRAGANDYLTKPLDPEMTLTRVSLHLRLRQAQAELELSQERYLMAAEGSRIGLWDWDVASGGLFLSSRWKQMLGLDDAGFEEDISQWLDRIHPADRHLLLELLHVMPPGQQRRFECELRMMHQDENFRWMQCAGVVQADAEGRPRRLAGSLADITEGKVRDVLTGLPNRLLFEERVDHALRRARRHEGLSAVLFLDLDKFKLVNDSLGHDAGDLLLCSVARRIENCLNCSDAVVPCCAACCAARHGGDEFTILLENVRSREVAERLAQQIITALSEPFTLKQHDVSIGVSIGIAFLHDGMNFAADAIREADTAMYHAKTSGRGRYRVYDPEMQTVAAARLALETEVRQALKTGQFHVAYQPIVSLATGRVDGFEALCRWRHPRGEMIGPDVFIPILESLGLIGELGKLLLGIAGRQIVEWNRLLPRQRPLAVTINCSTREFSLPQFHRDLLAQVAHLDVDPSMLRLEVTESTLMENPELAKKAISELRAVGIAVGIDDFGTGYSSFSYLHRLPLDTLKVDKSFVHSMQQGNESYEIVRTIIALARGLNLTVVAEGVERQDQHDLLTRLGATHAQGYLYAKPQSPDDITRLLLTGKPLTMHSFRGHAVWDGEIPFADLAELCSDGTSSAVPWEVHSS